MKTATCPKCCGNGRISGLDHIENGVCFQCSGNGTIRVREQAPAPMTAEQIEYQALQARRGEWVLAVTPEKAARLTWKQIHGAFNYAAAAIAQNMQEFAGPYKILRAEFLKQCDG